MLSHVWDCGVWQLSSPHKNSKKSVFRKVMGASVQNVVTLMSGQFIKLVLIACLIALPLAWYGINTWLNEFAFRVDLALDLFLVPVVILLVICLATVSFQILKRQMLIPQKCFDRNSFFV
jgi:putative ABC transport system permease protein